MRCLQVWRSRGIRRAKSRLHLAGTGQQGVRGDVFEVVVRESEERNLLAYSGFVLGSAQWERW